MKKILILAFLLIGLHVVSANEHIVPTEDFTKAPHIQSMKISPNGKYLAFSHRKGTQTVLSVIDRKSEKITASYSMGENMHIGEYFWFNEERLSMQFYKRIGWLDGSQCCYNWIAGNWNMKKRKALWDSSLNSRIQMIDRLKSDDKHILVAKSHWTEGTIKISKMNIYNGKLTKLSGMLPNAKSNNPGLIGAATDMKEDIRVAIELDAGENDWDWKDDVYFMHYKNKSGKWNLFELNTKREKPLFQPKGFSLDNNILYFASDFDLEHGDTEATTGLFSFDLRTRKVKLLFRHQDVDIGHSIYGKNEQLIGVYYEAGYPEVFYIDNENNLKDIKFAKSLAASFPTDYVSISSRANKNRYALVDRRGDRNPGIFYLYDAKDVKLSYLGSTMSHIEPTKMARVEPFAIKARDGLKMYGQLTIPNNVIEKNLPMIVFPHGGPYGVRDRWRWDDRAQFFANRGYLVLQLNYRGSGGYGMGFQEAGYAEWGRKMQDDITDATHWAINSGIADSDRICIHGVSYGGYASMQAVVKEPDLYKCSIPDAGPYELKVQLDIADSFKGGRSRGKEIFFKQMLGENPEERNKEVSPYYHVDKVKADIFIVHGSEDIRVPIENAYMLEKALKKANKPYIKMYKKDGHGFTKQKHANELFEAMLKFIEKNIGKGAQPKTK